MPGDRLAVKLRLPSWRSSSAIRRSCSAACLRVVLTSDVRRREQKARSEEWDSPRPGEPDPDCERPECRERCAHQESPDDLEGREAAPNQFEAWALPREHPGRSPPGHRREHETYATNTSVNRAIPSAITTALRHLAAGTPTTLANASIRAALTFTHALTVAKARPVEERSGVALTCLCGQSAFMQHKPVLATDVEAL